MTRSVLPSTPILLCCAVAILISLNACSGFSVPASAPSDASAKIQHVVIIFQENRTPDNLFQDPNLISNGADVNLINYVSLSSRR